MGGLTADRLAVETRPYCVHIGDQNGAFLGSGLLYYPGEGDQVFVFTCAHVVDGAEELAVHMLLPRDPDRDEYQTCCLTASARQIHYSPLNQRTETPDGERIHSHDVAVIVLQKRQDLVLEPTDYYVAESERGRAVYAQGYPGGWYAETEELLEALDRMNGTIQTSIASKPTFALRSEDPFLDQSDRAYELKGFSGAPVWYVGDKKHSVFGLIASGRRQTVYRSTVNAVKMSLLQSIMKQDFGIGLETKILEIPEEEVAERRTQHLVSQPCREDGNGQDAWALEQERKLRALVDDLRFGQAIELGQMTLEDPRFRACSRARRMRLMKYLMYCYDTCLLEEQAEVLERQMREEGMLDGHDSVRWLSKLFGMQRYQEVLDYAQGIPETDEAYPLGEFFGTMARAFVKGEPPERTVGRYVDDRERLREPAKDRDTEALYLQVIGFVYSACYQMPEKAIRCLNLSYRLNAQSIVLETLGCAYYQLALKNAVDDGGKLHRERINRAHLYKARACFLILMEKEDPLCFEGAIKRMGWQIFHTFVFLQDNYRILELYPLMRDHFPFQKREDRREVERHYASIAAQSGQIDLSQFSQLTDEDHILFRTAARINSFALRAMDEPEQGDHRALEDQLRETIAAAEDCVGQVSPEGGLPVRWALMRLYSKGIQSFGWDTLPDMRRHFQLICAASDPQMAEEAEALMYRHEHTYEECVRHFQDAYEREPSFRSWNTLTGVHIHFGKLETADARYQELFRVHGDLLREEPEYIYRACLDYVRENRRDLKIALQCYVDGRDHFDDKDIFSFWELELMLMTCSFNQPERFETERLEFMERGLMEAEVYHRNAMLAYMENLNAPKAAELFSRLPQPVDLSKRENLFFLAWQRQIIPVPDGRRNLFAPGMIQGLIAQFGEERWDSSPEKDYLTDCFRLERVCCLDAWSLYLLAEGGQLPVLEDMDRVYVSHCTIDRLLFEISSYPNFAVHLALEYLAGQEKVCICSADFAHQLKVRDQAAYCEPAAAVAVALERDCLAVLGEPCLDPALRKAFSGRIVRPTKLFSIS